MRVGVATDHGGFGLKQEFVAPLLDILQRIDPIISLAREHGRMLERVIAEPVSGRRAL